jgi:hypothetical protein
MKVWCFFMWLMELAEFDWFEVEAGIPWIF